MPAIAAADAAHAETKVTKEHKWQAAHIPTKLRQEVVKRVIVQKRGDGIFIKVQKDKDF